MPEPHLYAISTARRSTSGTAAQHAAQGAAGRLQAACMQQGIRGHQRPHRGCISHCRTLCERWERERVKHSRQRRKPWPADRRSTRAGVYL